MLPDKKVKCPYTGFKSSCFDGVTKSSCPKWIQILGRNPQTGEDMNRYGCSDSFMPLLMIENSQMQRQTGAAVESFRNEMVRMNDNQLLPPSERMKLIN
jgi:hypothetical protein